MVSVSIGLDSAHVTAETDLGPIINDDSWQARADGGFAMAAFTVDWDHERVVCPKGHGSRSWKPYVDRYDRSVIAVQVVPTVCRACPIHADCTRAAGRKLTLQAQEHHETMLAIRRRQTTAEFQQAYAVRAGIEGAISQAVHRSGMRRARYRGQAKVHLQAILTAAALNVTRIGAWLLGTPLARTRQSAFARLAA